MTDTQLDQVHRAGDRMVFFSALAGTELFVLLEREAEADVIDPQVFETEEGHFLLAFDRVDRLASFVGRPAPYAAMTGRALAGMLAGQGIGVALNPDVAPSSELLPPEALDWLIETLGQGPDQIGARPVEIAAPRVPEALILALDQKLASAVGLARAAYLVAATYETSGAGHILAFIDAPAAAEPALAQAVSEALIFSGIEAGTLDVAFFDHGDPMAARLAATGLRFDLPEPEVLAPPSGPGLDPAKPPKLR